MTAVFVDTSGLLALVNTTDEHHVRAARIFQHLRVRLAPLTTTSFVLVETYALVGRRLGMDAVERVRQDVAPLIDVVWVDESLHDAGLDLLLDRRRRQLSLVDAVSFVTMRRLKIGEAFAFDPHFEQEGFVIAG